MKRAVIILVVLVIVAFVGLYLWGPSKVPSGQPSLTTLSASNFTNFASAFDADPTVPRLILLFSPT
jgi:hypothetical protein